MNPLLVVFHLLISTVIAISIAWKVSEFGLGCVIKKFKEDKLLVKIIKVVIVLAFYPMIAVWILLFLLTIIADLISEVF